MGKGDRRHKAPPKGLPELAPIVSGKAHARDRRATNGPKDDPRKVALTARCHHLGIGADRDSRRKVTAPHLGSDLGRVMHMACSQDEAARLWSVWQAWCMAERTYRLRYLGQAGEPKGATIALLPEKMEADTGHTIDTRTPDERDRDSVNTWMRWQGFLGKLPASTLAVVLHQARREDGPTLWADRKPTEHGTLTLDALRLLADIVERETARADRRREAAV